MIKQKKCSLILYAFIVFNISCASTLKDLSCRKIAGLSSEKCSVAAENKESVYVVPFPMKDSYGKDIQRPSIGVENAVVRWANKTPENNFPIERVTRQRINFKIDSNNEVVGLDILLPNEKVHHIKVTKGGFVIVDEKLTKELVLNTGIEFLPLKAITNLKKINFNYLSVGTLGEVNTFSPRKIKLSINQPSIETLTHEFGHVTHYHTKLFYFRWRKAMKKDNKVISRYATTNRKEDFAETLVAYLEPNKVLNNQYRKQYPHRFALMDKILDGEHLTQFSIMQRLLPGPNPYAGSILFLGVSTLIGILTSGLFISFSG